MDKIITLLTKKKMKMSVALPQSSCGLYSTKRLWQTTRQMKVRSLGNMLRKKKKKNLRNREEFLQLIDQIGLSGMI